jgi:hypothetical protein
MYQVMYVVCCVLCEGSEFLFYAYTALYSNNPSSDEECSLCIEHANISITLYCYR